MAHEIAFFRRDVVDFDLVELSFDVFFEGFDIGLIIFGGVFVGAVNFVESYIVAGEYSVSAVYGAVEDIAYQTYGLGTGVAHPFEFGVDALSHAEMHTTFLLEYACLHAEKIVAFGLLVVRITAFEHEFAHFEIVVWIES